MLGQNVPSTGLYNSPNVLVGHKKQIKIVFLQAQTGGVSKNKQVYRLLI